MQIYNHIVPKEKFQQWQEIMIKTGGRYICAGKFPNPREDGDNYRVDYSPGNYQEECRAWKTITQDVKEVMRNQRWRIMLRRAGLKKL